MQADLFGGESPASTPDKFTTFWAQYPRKVGKAVAKRWFAKHKPSEEQFQEIMDALEIHRKLWKDTEIQFIPHASTWLNQERFEDDVSDELKKKIFTPKIVKPIELPKPTEEEFQRGKQAAANLKSLLGGRKRVL